MFGRNRIATMVAEFLGVAVLSSVILAVSKSGVGFSVFIAGGVGVALAGLTLAFGSRLSVQFNPAVTLGLWTAKKVPTVQAALALVAQFLGGLAAWRMYEFLVNQPLNSIANKAFDWRILAAEAVGTFLLTFMITAAIHQGYRGLRMAAAAGSALFLGALVASIASNGLVNPAVALGVHSWSRAYTLGPLLGGIVGANLYALLFAPILKPAVRPVVASEPVTIDDESVPAPARKRLTRRKHKK